MKNALSSLYNSKNPLLAYLLVNLATLLWASNMALGRALRDQIGPVSLSAARFLVAGLFFLPLLSKEQGRSQGNPKVNRQPDISPARSEWLLFASMALTGVFGFPILLYLALQSTSTTQVSMIHGLGPVVTLLIAAVVLRERVKPSLALGGLISLTGVVLILSDGSLGFLQSWGINTGDLIALITVVLWGSYSVMSKIASRSHSTRAVTAYATWLALPFLLVAAVLEWRSGVPGLTLEVLLAALYIGVFPTVVAFLAWNEGIRRLGPNRAMAFYNMLPVFGALLGAIFLGETIGWQHLVGGALVIAGGVLAALYR